MLRILIFCATFLGASRANAQCTLHNAISFRSPVVTTLGLVATPIFQNLTTPRGITFDSHQNLLVIERGLGVTAFSEDKPGCDGWFRTVVLPRSDLTQGIQVDTANAWLYVSTSGQVLRYSYDAATTSVTGAPEVIISGIPPDGELTTRPLLLSRPTTLLVSSALATNIDPTARDPSSGRSQIRSFTIQSTPNAVPQDFFSGRLLAFGIRNPAGFAFSPSLAERLWVVENGASIDNVTGVTPAFVNDNPADELERVDTGKPARFFGFPDCTTLWNPTADPVGAPQFVHLHTGDQFSLQLEPDRDDEWCRDPANNDPPKLSFQAHSVPLDVKFFTPAAQGDSTVSLPSAWGGDAFVSFHGSFNRDPPTGYGVVRVPFSNNSPVAPRSSQQGYSFLVQAANLNTCPGTCIRPVGLAFADDGRLFASSDSSGELFFLSGA